MKPDEPVPVIIRCSDCDQNFTFTVGEQEFYADKGFTPPKRCRDCRAVRKAKREEGRGQ